MSLINKVLKDLETRSRVAGDTPAKPMLEDLRAAPTAPARLRVGGLAGTVFVVGILCLVGAAAWYWFGMRPAPMVPQAMSQPSFHKPPQAVPPAMVSASPPLAVVSATAAASPKRGFTFLPKALPAPHQRSSQVHAVHVPVARAPHKRVARMPATRSRSLSLGAISRRPTVMTPAEQSQTRYREAIVALQQGNTGRARRALKAALILNPMDLRPRLLLSALDVQSGQLPAAHALLAQGLTQYPDALSVVLLLAQVDLRQGHPKSAVKVLAHRSQAALQSEPYWALLAAAQMRAGDTMGAIDTYHQALQRFGDNGTLWVGLGLAEWNNNRPHIARQAWLRAQKCVLSPVLADFVKGELAHLP
ncbi:MAG: tetratricopeptide repeat protein [Acidiferrobacter sp.]